MVGTKVQTSKALPDLVATRTKAASQQRRPWSRSSSLTSAATGGSGAVCGDVGDDQDADDGEGRLDVRHASDDVLRVHMTVLAEVGDGACQRLCLTRSLAVPQASALLAPLTWRMRSITKSSSLRPKAKSSICVARFSLNLMMVLADWL